MNRNDVTELIVSRKLGRKLRWDDVAEAVGQSMWLWPGVTRPRWAAAAR